MGKATGWGDFQKKWHLGHPNKRVHQGQIGLIVCLLLLYATTKSTSTGGCISSGTFNTKKEKAF